MVVYDSPYGEVRVDVRLEQVTVWLSQRDMETVFGTRPQNIVMHLRHVFSSGELEAEATSKDFLLVQTEGNGRVRRRMKHYNLDAIISVGYRVNSKRGVRFRQWATRTLREHLVRGFTANERRLAERGACRERTAACHGIRQLVFSQPVACRPVLASKVGSRAISAPLLRSASRSS
ncbi:virulence RhuM family protein [Candidatus Foliamicus sp.]